MATLNYGLFKYRTFVTNKRVCSLKFISSFCSNNRHKFISDIRFNRRRFFSSKLNVQENEPRNTILGAYFSRIYDGVIREDDHQLKIVQSLQHLDDALRNYSPPVSSPLAASYLFKSFAKAFVDFEQTDNKPKGLYLWGSVGCGKTFLMDLFYQNCSIKDENKHRLHFHRFMLDIHAEIHQVKLGKLKNINVKNQKNPIPTVAKLLASRTWLLCLDEFQVTDVADAMILKQLFQYLFEAGVILLATSNRCPDDLYKSGLQRSAFMPFIPLLKQNCDVVCLDSHIDYRRTSTSIKKVYFLTSNSGINESLDSIFKVLSINEDDIIRPLTITVNNREVHLRKTCGRVADCDFSELCQVPLGADDYDKMGKLFHTVIIRNIPQLTIKQKSEAKRFITLIDMLYDARTRVIFSSAVPIEQLFKLNTDPNEYMDHKQESLNLMDDLGLHASEGKKLNLVTGEEEIFACDRTVSRVIEMQTNQYWDMFSADHTDKESETDNQF